MDWSTATFHPARRLVSVERFLEFVKNRITQVRRRHDRAFLAPAQYPVADLRRFGDHHAQLHAAVWQLKYLLRTVPRRRGHSGRNPRREPEHNLHRMLRCPDPPRIAQQLAKRRSERRAE